MKLDAQISLIIRFNIWFVHQSRFVKQIDRDGHTVQVKLDARISLIGGTMGLFTGFSIISGVEICFFVTRVLIRFFLSKLREVAAKILPRGDEK